MRRPSPRFLLFLRLSRALVIACVVWPAIAFAAGSKAVAIFIEGGDSDSVASEIAGALPSELTVVDQKKFATEMRKAGQGQLGNAIAIKGALRDKMLGRTQKAMEAAEADAAILGRVRIGRQGKEVWVVWLSATGDVKVDQAISLRGEAADRRTAMREALEGPAKELAPSSSSSSSPSSGGPEIAPSGPEKDKADKDKSDKPEPKGARLKNNAGTSLFSLGAAFEMGGRIVEFSDPITQNIRPYQVIGAPMVHVAGEVYPAAGTGIKVLKDIGITGRFSMALGLTSATEGGESSTGNTWMRFRGGLKWRFLPGSEKGPILALTGDFGMDIFSFDDAGDLSGSVPSVEYQYLRAGGEVRLPIGPIAFELNGGYRGILGLGETGNRFTNPQALAFDAGAAFVVMLPLGFETRLAADYTRVVYSFGPNVGDEYVAGGLVDEMLGARVGVAYVY